MPQILQNGGANFVGHTVPHKGLSDVTRSPAVYFGLNLVHSKTQDSAEFANPLQRKMCGFGVRRNERHIIHVHKEFHMWEPLAEGPVKIFAYYTKQQPGEGTALLDPPQLTVGVLPPPSSEEISGWAVCPTKE